MSPHLKQLQAELAEMLRGMPLPEVEDDAFVPTDASARFIALWSQHPFVPINVAWAMAIAAGGAA